MIQSPRSPIHCLFDTVCDTLWLPKPVSTHVVKYTYFSPSMFFLDFLLCFKSSLRSKAIKCFFLSFLYYFIGIFCSIFKYLLFLELIYFSWDFILKNFKYAENLTGAVERTAMYPPARFIITSWDKNTVFCESVTKTIDSKIVWLHPVALRKASRGKGGAPAEIRKTSYLSEGAS